MTSIRLGRLLAALVLIPVFAAGCAGAPAGDGGSEPTTAAMNGPADIPPSELVGLWRVSAEGESEDTWVQIASATSPNEFTLWRECGWLSGWWLAGADTLLVSLDSGSGDCISDAADLQVDWLLATRGFAADGEDRVLLDASGEVVAHLTVDGAPPPNPNIIDDYREQPELTEQEAAALDARPQPLPDGLEPATAEELLGRWVPLTTYSTEPYLELADDGTWSGSDGCNGAGGRWLLDTEGALLATAGPQTLIGCEGESLGSSFVSASWLVVDGDLLTFYDDAGEELGQATRG